MASLKHISHRSNLSDKAQALTSFAYSLLYLSPIILLLTVI